jgi:hypothetical protein
MAFLLHGWIGWYHADEIGSLRLDAEVLDEVNKELGDLKALFGPKAPPEVRSSIYQIFPWRGCPL